MTIHLPRRTPLRSSIRARAIVWPIALAACHANEDRPTVARAAVPEQRFVGCAPCTVRIAPHLPAYHVTMELAVNAAEDSVVTALRVQPVGAPAGDEQRLAVGDTVGGMAVGQEIYTEDLNRDGYMDLVLSTGQGLVNRYYDYFLFDPGRRRFVPLGNYPALDRVGDTDEFTTFERNSAVSYTRQRYRMAGGGLVRVASDIAEPRSFRSDSVVRVVTTLREGRMEPICREMIVPTGPEPASASDTIPAPTRCPPDGEFDRPRR